MQIVTKRCVLIPLTIEQLYMWADDIMALENEIGYEYDGEIIVGTLHNIIIKQISIIEKSPSDYPCNSSFLIAVKDIGAVVGAISFKGTSNSLGEIEIGYGLAKHHQHNGYMTEAVKGMCEFALAQPNIKNVIAETEICNYASQQVLLRCGFKQYKETNTIWWRI